MAKEAGSGPVGEMDGGERASATASRTLDVDAMIRQVEQLYGEVTGQAPPTGARPYAQIPPEKDPLQHVEEQVERLIGLVTEAVPATLRPAPPWSPPASMWDCGDEVRLCVDLPGVPRASVEVWLRGGAIEVVGSRPTPGAERGERASGASLIAAETRVGAFRRTLPLPPGAAIDRLQVSLRDGVLEVRAPKAASGAEPRSLPVR